MPYNALFDLSTLNLPLGSYSIQVTAKAKRYENSDPSSSQIWKTVTPITINISGGYYIGDPIVYGTDPTTITVIPDPYFSLPSTITVTGCSYSYDNTTGIIVITNPTKTMSISVVCIYNQWETPTIELNGDIVSTDIVEGITKYKVYDNGTYIGYVDEDNNWHGN